MPSITLDYNNSKILDTQILQSSPTSSYGTSTSFQVGVGAASNNVSRALLFFDLGLIPNDTIINSATLTLTQMSGSASSTINLHKATSVWDENVTWGTAPAFNPAVGASVAVTNITPAVDVKNIVQDWVNGASPNYGFLLKNLDETTLNTVHNYYSRDYQTTPSNRPKLTIDYTIPTTGKKQVEYVGYKEFGSTGATSVNVPVPTGAQVGDLLVAAFQIASSAVFTPPAGWSTFLNRLQSVSGTRYIAIYKFLSSGESAYTFTFPSSQFFGGALHAYRNVKSASSVSSHYREVSGTQYYPNALVTGDVTFDKGLLVIFNGAYVSGPAGFSTPLGFTEVIDSLTSTILYQTVQTYMHTKRTYTIGEMQANAAGASNGLSYLMVLEPFTNNPPTLTLSSPADNLLLTEGSTYTLAGTASDPDNGNAVTVKYSINGGTARNITSAISDGASPIPFSKVLTFQNGRLYDGATDVSGPLAENTTYNVSVYAVDDQGGTSPSYTRSFKVILNRPPNITLDPYNAEPTGLSELEKLTFSGTITDPENDNVNLTVSFNGGDPVTLKSGVPSGTTFEYPVLVSALQSGANTLVFTATDTKGAPKTKTLTLNKTGTQAPVKTAVTRYSITPPLGSTAEIVAWVNREAGDLTVDTAYSIVGSDANESFAAMTKNASVPVGDGTVYEDEFVGTAAQAAAKVTLRLTLTRADVSSDDSVKKIMGGIG